MSSSSGRLSEGLVVMGARPLPPIAGALMHFARVAPQLRSHHEAIGVEAGEVGTRGLWTLPTKRWLPIRPDSLEPPIREVGMETEVIEI
jgi:hypothetical protein